MECCLHEEAFSRCQAGPARPGGSAVCPSSSSDLFAALPTGGSPRRVTWLCEILSPCLQEQCSWHPRTPGWGHRIFAAHPLPHPPYSLPQNTSLQHGASFIYRKNFSEVNRKWQVNFEISLLPANHFTRVLLPFYKDR